MFICLNVIRYALDVLNKVHPFYGITYLACKKSQLPSGATIEFEISKLETLLLDNYFKLAAPPKPYYQVFRTAKKQERWLNADYASSGSQKTRTTTFDHVFIHSRGSKLWGWKPEYVELLTEKLSSANRQTDDKHRIPAFALAVWIYRKFDWEITPSSQQIIEKFFTDFFISEEEREKLFYNDFSDNISFEFQTEPIEFRHLKHIIGFPPDTLPDQGGTLHLLECKNIGPSEYLHFEPSERINVIMGDNGLGKTFLLDCIWWALSGTWSGLPAFPEHRFSKAQPEIHFRVMGEQERTFDVTAMYDFRKFSWQIPARERPVISGLMVYSRVDGSFAVWDPYRLQMPDPVPFSSQAIIFSSDAVWDGLRHTVNGKEVPLCNGLISDWMTWQNNPQRYGTLFQSLKTVLLELSPSDLGTLEPGEPTRIPHDARDIPTIRHLYGDIPIMYASAGIKRIVAMAYLLVWAWNEHRSYATMMGQEPQQRMVMLMDEVEAHLHPQWQRTIVPALVRAMQVLKAELQVQYFLATHSPMIMLSLESIFDSSSDSLVHFDIGENVLRPEIVLQSIPFEKRGTANSWLITEEFGLKQPTSTDTEKALISATELMMSDNPTPERIREISARLMKLLPTHDTFWSRWSFFAFQHGVSL